MAVKSVEKNRRKKVLNEVCNRVSLNFIGEDIP